jgi:hypothetical protein
MRALTSGDPSTQPETTIMFKKSLAALAGLAAMAGAGGAADLTALAAAAKLQEAHRHPKPGKGGSKSKSGRSYGQQIVFANGREVFKVISTGKRYPEQSTRQAMRRHRRAQGGPGLMFDPGTRSWELRPDGIVIERPLTIPF